MRRAIVMLMLLASCDTKDLRDWKSAVHEKRKQPSVATIGMQLGLCLHPPADAPASDLKYCAEVVAPAAFQELGPIIEA